MSKECLIFFKESAVRTSILDLNTERQRHMYNSVLNRTEVDCMSKLHYPPSE